MDNPTCPETGQPTVRGIRPMTITHKGRSATFDMPGWYCEASSESIHTGKDLKVSDRDLNRLRAKVEGLLLPKDAPDQEAAGIDAERRGTIDWWRHHDPADRHAKFPVQATTEHVEENW